MAQNSKFAIQLLEKIGAPLAAAIESVPLKGEDADVESAKLMAQMLGQAVQVSIALNNSLGVTESEEQADSTRLALAALAAPLLAGFYRQNERVADDQDIKRIVKSLEAVLAFAENFTPAAEENSRLATIDHDSPLFDETQASLVVLQSMTPVIQAIAEFPFGQSETKLMQEVSDKLKAKAADINGSSGNKLGELMALKALAQLYADCHAAETARLASASDENRGELSLDPVWAAFDTKVAMVETIMGTESGATAGGETPQPAAQESAPPPAEAPVEKTEAPAPADPPAETSSGPMGFFKPGAKTEQPPPAAETPPVPQVEETKAEAPPPPADQPSEPPAAEPPSGAPGNPMGFFKPGAKKEGNDGENSGESAT